ncbi:MAG: hypothetical protein WBX01_01690 [Nitrososphaeraceae archaeon]
MYAYPKGKKNNEALLVATVLASLLLLVIMNTTLDYVSASTSSPLVNSTLTSDQLAAGGPQPAQASFNPFEGLFSKSELESKQEIYKGVDNSLASQIEACKKTSLQPCAAENVDAVELTNRIYEEEKLEGKEYSEVTINTKVGSEVIDEIWK